MRDAIILVMFDLPSNISDERRAYRKFIALLKRSGYHRIQESVFIKYHKNISSSKRELSFLAINGPKNGEILALPVNIKTAKSIKTVSGNGIDWDYIGAPIIVV